MQKIIVDEEFRNLIPPLTSDEYKQLEANIVSEGCRDPLVLWIDTLLDGHNRYKICTEHSIKFETVQKDLPNRQAAIEWIILNQFGRRNLTTYQRSELALKLKPIIEAKAKERQGSRTDLNIVQKSAPSEQGKTRDELAKLAGVSHDTIDKSAVIQRDGTTEQIERARIGGKGNSVSAIYNEIKGISKDKKAEQPPTTPPVPTKQPESDDISPIQEKSLAEPQNSEIITGNPKEADKLPKSDEYPEKPISSMSKKDLKELSEKLEHEFFSKDRKFEYTINNLIQEINSLNEYYNRNVNIVLSNDPKILESKSNRVLVKKAIENIYEIVKTIEKEKSLL